MNRLLTVLFIATAYVSAAYGRSDWYDKPLAVAEGLTVIEEVGEDASIVKINVRASANVKHAAKWGIAWGDIASADYIQAVLHIPKPDFSDGIYAQYARLVVSRVDAAGSVSIIDQEVRGVDITGGANSIKLVCGEGTYLLVGTSDPEVIELPVDEAPVAQAVIIAYDPIECQYIGTEVTVESDRPYSRYTSVDALYEAINRSSDPREGVWEYLDRSIDATKAMLGGNYTLATVRRGDGYDLVYIKGAKYDSDEWRELRLKGHITSTIFKGNYDMVWYTSSGLRLDEDVNAQYSDDGAVLTLRFPLLNSEIRLRRLFFR